MGTDDSVNVDSGGDPDDGVDTEDSEDERASGAKNDSPRKNYITPAGLKALQGEYHQLFHVERPKLVEIISWAASNGDRSENGDYIYGKRRLREVDRRLRFLGRRMASAVVVPSAEQPKDEVLFGARVTVAKEGSQQWVYCIVGEDEIDLDNRKISWVSPVAKALMHGRVGDTVVVQRPNGETELTIVKIEYL